jgi:ferredoxin
MSAIKFTIDGRPVQVEQGKTILDGARHLGIDIPTLCYLEKCGPLNSCQACLVKVVAQGGGRLVPSCGTAATEGLVVESETTEVHEARRTALELLFSDHVGDCLSPCHRLCPLLLNIPVMIRHIQGGHLAEAVATVCDTLPLPSVLGRLCHHPCEQGCRRGNWDSPAAIRDMEFFVAAENRAAPEPRLPIRKPASGKKVAIIGAGPAGLSVAWYLNRHGHTVVVMDRRAAPGGTLRDVPESDLPSEELASDIALLGRSGVEFKAGIELGAGITIDDLTRDYDAVVLAVGEAGKTGTVNLGVAMAGTAVKTDPNNCRTNVARVFACGGAVKPVKQVVRALAEGRAAAECVHLALLNQEPRRPEKPFSSMMGRMDPGEIKEFLRSASPAKALVACDRCRGLNRREASSEAARCLHCDCRSSGNCALQHYGQVYGAEASRFKSERRRFEQQAQPAGVIFEPGKCILCGICVKLAEMEMETLGLAFVGRGFDVRVAAPFGHAVNDGLRKVAEECVRHCPTGALVFGDHPLNAPAQLSGR